VKRRLFTIFSALSLLICVAVVALWARGRRVEDRVEYSYFTGEGDDRSGIQHGVYVQGGELTYLGSKMIGVSQSARFATQSNRLNWRAFPRGTTEMNWGFRLGRSELTGPAAMGRGEEYWWVTVPCWSVCALTGTLPVIWAHRRWKSRTKVGCCPSCNYDLRATPDRCPECGRVPAAPPPP
jgi:hypothetical protein